ncbi:unnamed protein product [Hyaloperonospora brassicae]|uniref:Lipid-binding serum glycoprotein C-terminal domain-containing protein n=1 Tax=Hyaloperonospora brassicae TaxID=162125 RepID=A0AAV0UQL8_HYABA|nr:unnamed protein product [Hyaloperonospora brassicae]
MTLSRTDDATLQPLLDRSDTPDVPPHDDTLHTTRTRVTVSWKVVLGVVAGSILIVHIVFVALLRKTTVTLHQLTLPDLCHRESVGELVMAFQNPSYCSPIVGPLDMEFATKDTAFLRVHVAAFELQSGVTTVVSPVHFTLLTSPQVLYQLVLASNGHNVHVEGRIPVSISCMLVPFTIHFDVSDLLRASSQPPATALLLPKQRHTLGSHVYRADTAASRIVNEIMAELQRVVKQVVQTIALSHFHTEEDAQEIFAYTDVSIEYASRVLWNLPSLSIEVQSVNEQTILVAGFKRFLLGSGQTFISAFTEVFKNQSEPLLSMLQSYLSGNDVVLHVRGGNIPTQCYSLQVLDLVNVEVDVPAKIDSEPAFLRAYSITPMVKNIDSKSHICDLELTVSIRINNPLPIHLALYGIELDLLYERNATSHSPSSKFLLHVNNTTMHVAWHAHEAHTIGLTTAVHDFDACIDVVTFYLQNQLTFDIQHGSASLGSDLGTFSIPFSVQGIHITPSARSPQPLPPSLPSPSPSPSPIVSSNPSQRVKK